MDADADPTASGRRADAATIRSSTMARAASDRRAGRTEDHVEAVALGLDLGSGEPTAAPRTRRAVPIEEVRGGGRAVLSSELGVVAQVGEEEGPVAEFIGAFIL